MHDDPQLQMPQMASFSGLGSNCMLLVRNLHRDQTRIQSTYSPGNFLCMGTGRNISNSSDQQSRPIQTNLESGSIQSYNHSRYIQSNSFKTESHQLQQTRTSFGTAKLGRFLKCKGYEGRASYMSMSTSITSPSQLQAGSMLLR